MSTKQKTTTSKDEGIKIPPKEMIVTRCKSAQLKRQLREKDRSMKSITQLLKNSSPKAKKNQNTKAPKNKSSGRKNDKESATKKNTANIYKEYYPNKLKRDMDTKKVVLKPKDNSKLLANAGSFKRKPLKPRKGIKSNDSEDDLSIDTSSLEARTRSLCQAENWSLRELVKVIDVTEPLDDNDLMEILTCPSPVWWEESTNEDYEEGSLKKHTNNELDMQKLTVDQNTENKILEQKTSDITNLKSKQSEGNGSSNSKCDKKKNKLEDILSSIKNKIVTLKTDKNCAVRGETLDNLNIKDDSVVSGTSLKGNGGNANTSEPSASEMAKSSTESLLGFHTKKASNEADKKTDDILADTAALIRNLESIEIPIQASVNNCESKEKESESSFTPFLGPGKQSGALDPKSYRRRKQTIIPKCSTFQELIPQSISLDGKKPNSDRVHSLGSSKRQLEKDDVSFSAAKIKTYSKKSISQKERVIEVVKLQNKMLLVECNNNIADRKRKHSQTSDNKSPKTSNPKECKNKLLKRDENHIVDIKSKDKLNDICSIYSNKNGINQLNSKDDFINVLNIKRLEEMNPEPINDKSDDRNSIDGHRCDLNKQNGKQSVDDLCNHCHNKDNKKPIFISDNNIVKYCFKCSAIFDTENCMFCCTV